MKSIARIRQEHRGGMTCRGYKAEFERGAVEISVYVTPQGLYEQFLVEQDI